MNIRLINKILVTYLLLLILVTGNAQISTNQGFEILGNVPSDTRDTLTTLGDTSNVVWIYPGLLSYAVDQDQFWYHNGSYWSLFAQGGGLDNFYLSNDTLYSVTTDSIYSVFLPYIDSLLLADSTTIIRSLISTAGSQYIDTLLLQGDTLLKASIFGDGIPALEINLSPLKDNLGNHTMTQNLQTNGNWISGDGDNEGISVDAAGKVGVGTLTPSYILDINSSNSAVKFPVTTSLPLGTPGLLTYSPDSTSFLGYYNAQWNRLVDHDYLSSTTGQTASNYWVKSGNDLYYNTGNIGIGQTTPTAVLHLKAGTATANTAPLKFTSGTNLTTPEAGAMEWDGTNLFITQTTGPTRKQIAYTTDIVGDGNGLISALPAGDIAINAMSNTLNINSLGTAGSRLTFTDNYGELATGSVGTVTHIRTDASGFELQYDDGANTTVLNGDADSLFMSFVESTDAWGYGFTQSGLTIHSAPGLGTPTWYKLPFANPSASTFLGDSDGDRTLEWIDYSGFASTGDVNLDTFSYDNATGTLLASIINDGLPASSVNIPNVGNSDLTLTSNRTLNGGGSNTFQITNTGGSQMFVGGGGISLFGGLGLEFSLLQFDQSPSLGILLSYDNLNTNDGGSFEVSNDMTLISHQLDSDNDLYLALTDTTFNFIVDSTGSGGSVVGFGIKYGTPNPYDLLMDNVVDGSAVTEWVTIINPAGGQNGVQQSLDSLWANITAGGGASQLSDLSDVNTSTPTNRNVLVADGVDWESRALTEADISDLTHTGNGIFDIANDEATVPAGLNARLGGNFSISNSTGNVFFITKGDSQSVGIGSSSTSAGYNLSVSEIVSGTSGTVGDIAIGSSIAPSATSSLTYNGIVSSPLISGSNNITGDITAAVFYPYNSGSGTISNLYGVKITPVTLGGTITNMKSLAIAPSRIVSGTVTNVTNIELGLNGTAYTNYSGLKVLNTTAATTAQAITLEMNSGTNKYNIYASGSADNYFAGDVGIGVSSPDYSLDVTGTLGVTGTVRFEGYGQGNKEVGDLALTNSGYLATYATDGTLMEIGLTNPYGGESSITGVLDSLYANQGGGGITSYAEMYINLTDPDTISFAGISDSLITETTAGELANFTHSNGRLTYTGSATIKVAVRVSASFTYDNIGTLGLLVYKNGTYQEKSRAEHNILSGEANSARIRPISTNCILTLSQNDYVEVGWETNTAGSTVLTTEDLNVIVTKL